MIVDHGCAVRHLLQAINLHFVCTLLNVLSTLENRKPRQMHTSPHNRQRIEEKWKIAQIKTIKSPLCYLRLVLCYSTQPSSGMWRYVEIIWIMLFLNFKNTRIIVNCINTYLEFGKKFCNKLIDHLHLVLQNHCSCGCSIHRSSAYFLSSPVFFITTVYREPK